MELRREKGRGKGDYLRDIMKLLRMNVYIIMFPGIPLHIVENFGIIHGVVTCPWIVKHSGNRAALKKVTENHKKRQSY